MLDDLTGKSLIQSPDDTSKVLKKRLTNYNKENDPILYHYNPLDINAEVNANQKMQGSWRAFKKKQIVFIVFKW